MELDEQDYDELEYSVHEILDDCNTRQIPYQEEDIIDSFIEFVPDISDEIQEIIEQSIDSYYDLYQEKVLEEDEKTIIRNKLVALQNVYQPQQKTEEWYEYRNSLITASSAWKILKSQNTLNSYIYEKCCPYVPKNGLSGSHSLQWGVMFEPISLEIYQRRNQTCVAEFGCISHPHYSFLGASPDGINIDESSPLFGTMVEVKNIVNREITGIPKSEYWIQMQLQMEVCDLDHCDFLETRFKKMEIQDGITTLLESGILIQGTNHNNNDIRRFLIIDSTFTKERIEQWIQQSLSEFEYSEIIHWYLDEYSCIPIKRDREWFQQNIEKFKEAWQIIQQEKVTGYEHRKPKKRESGPNIHLFTEEENQEYQNSKKIKVNKIE